jgi:phosphatidylglycerophosphate synthase
MRSIPNLISLSRLVALAALLVAASFGARAVCLGLFAYCLVSDVVDGRLARALRQVSVLGARLDSAADCALVLTFPFVALLLFPSLRATETATILLVFAGYGVPMAYGLLKYRRLTSYHTTAARAAAVSLAGTFFLFLAAGIAWPLRAATGLLLLSAVEELAITRALPAWRADVSSLRGALRGIHPEGAGSFVDAWRNTT